jgi:hypothetical protein
MDNRAKEQKIDEILGRALRDREFRDRLTGDPAAAAAECGLSVEEMDMISGGLAIGDSLLNPSTVAWCTDKTCNETGKRQIDRGDPARRIRNPAIRTTPIQRPGVRNPVRQQADEGAETEARVNEPVEPAE